MVKESPLPFQFEPRSGASYPVRYFGGEENFLPSETTKHDFWNLKFIGAFIILVIE